MNESLSLSDTALREKQGCHYVGTWEGLLAGVRQVTSACDWVLKGERLPQFVIRSDQPEHPSDRIAK